MSHSATTLPYLPACSTSPLPLPPMPAHAMLIRSLGDLLLSSSAQVCRPATQKPMPAAAAPLRKSRRLGRMLLLVLRVMEPAPLPGGCAGERLGLVGNGRPYGP